MSQGDDRAMDDGNEEQPQRDERYDTRPPKDGMKSGTKVILILLAIFGGLALLCCGGTVFVVMKMKPDMSDDPVVVQKITQEITTIDIPAPFEAKQSVKIDFTFFSDEAPKMTMVVYHGTREDTMLMLMALETSEEIDAVQEVNMRQQMDQQGGGNAADLDNIEQLVPVVVTIRGTKVTFRIQKGTNQNIDEKVIQVQGAFKGKSGMVMLVVQMPEKEYDAESIKKMLMSIK